MTIKSSIENKETFITDVSMSWKCVVQKKKVSLNNCRLERRQCHSTIVVKKGDKTFFTLSLGDKKGENCDSRLKWQETSEIRLNSVLKSATKIGQSNLRKCGRDNERVNLEEGDSRLKVKVVSKWEKMFQLFSSSSSSVILWKIQL